METMKLTMLQLPSPIYGSDGSLVAEGVGLGNGSQFVGTILRKQQASYIMHAVNAHETLVKALQQILEGNTMAGRTDFTHADVLQEHYKIARTALAQAKKED